MSDSHNNTPIVVKQNEKITDKEETGTLQQEGNKQYPPVKIVIPTMLCLCLAFFLPALDRTIVGVAIPAISNEFQSFDDISWYEAAFLLTFCVCQLPMGRVYKYFSAKWTFVVIVIIFEIGSIVCASAPSSTAFIIGRAITGIGGAGTAVGAQVIIRDLLPLEKRPKYQGFFGAVFGLSSILGPLVGGAFTSDVSWRWCFWISVPISGVALAGLVFVLPASHAPEKLEGTFVEKLKKFDPIGNLVLAPGLVCLLLGLQWGGVVYPWNSARVITLLVIGSALLMAFVLTQCWVQENGMVPPRIFRQRTVVACTFVNLGIGSAIIISSFYLPIWFQAIKGLSAGAAGVRLLPYFLSTVLFVIASGIAVSKLGYYTPFLLLGTGVLIVATALLTTFNANSSSGQYIGFQVLLGVGFGLSLAQSNNAAQTVLSKEDIAVGTSIIAFAQQLGGTIFVSVAQTVLSTTLRSQLARDLPGFDTTAISRSGATSIRGLVSKTQLPIVLDAYNTAIDKVFYCALGAACLALAASLFVEWRSVKSKVSAEEESANV